MALLTYTLTRQGFVDCFTAEAMTGREVRPVHAWIASLRGAKPSLVHGMDCFTAFAITISRAV